MKRIDLHIHTVHSDGAVTVKEVVRRAKRAGVTCGICDHLSPYHKIYEPAAFDAYVADVRAYDVLLGAEYCIGEEIPVDETRLETLDYLMGGVHGVRVAGVNHYFWGDAPPADADAFVAAYVDVILKALCDDPLDILAHPTYLPSHLQDRYDEIWTPRRCEKIWEAAAARGVALEISGRWLVPRPGPLKLALDMGLTFSFGSDAHRRDELFNLTYPAAMAERLGIPDDRILLPRRGRS